MAVIRGASKGGTFSPTEKQQWAREALTQSPEARGGTHEREERTWGLPSSPADATKTYFASLCFFIASAAFNLTLFTAALQLLCKHISKSSGVLWWSPDSSALPQPRAAYISERTPQLGARWRTAQQVGKKLSKRLSITKQELRRVHTSPLMFTNSFPLLCVYPRFTFSSPSRTHPCHPQAAAPLPPQRRSPGSDGSQDGDYREGHESEAEKEQSKSLLGGKI